MHVWLMYMSVCCVLCKRVCISLCVTIYVSVYKGEMYMSVSVCEFECLCVSLWDRFYPLPCSL